MKFEALRRPSQSAINSQQSAVSSQQPVMPTFTISGNHGLIRAIVERSKKRNEQKEIGL
jgi:hypothetical protein